MVARHLAMFAREHDHGVVGLSAGFESLENPAKLIVYERHVREILCPQLPEAFFGGRVVNIASGLAERVVPAPHVEIGPQPVHE